MVLLTVFRFIGLVYFLLFSSLKSLLASMFSTYLAHHVFLVCQAVQALYGTVSLLALKK